MRRMRREVGNHGPRVHPATGSSRFRVRVRRGTWSYRSHLGGGFRQRRCLGSLLVFSPCGFRTSYSSPTAPAGLRDVRLTSGRLGKRKGRASRKLLVAPSKSLAHRPSVPVQQGGACFTRWIHASLAIVRAYCPSYLCLRRAPLSSRLGRPSSGPLRCCGGRSPGTSVALPVVG